MELEPDAELVKERALAVDSELLRYCKDIVGDHGARHGWSKRQTNDVIRSLRLLQVLQDTPGAKINDKLHAKLKDVDDQKFVTAAFETVLGTSPTKDELATCLDALTQLRAALKDVKEPERTKRVRLQVVQALINHNDFVTVR